MRYSIYNNINIDVVLLTCLVNPETLVQIIFKFNPKCMVYMKDKNKISEKHWKIAKKLFVSYKYTIYTK